MKNLDTDFAERHGEGVTRDETKLLHHDVTRAIIGGMYAVHTALGVGFLESVYANAMALVLRNAGLALSPHRQGAEPSTHGARSYSSGVMNGASA